MKTVPDLNKIGEIVRYWHMGIQSVDEATRHIARLLDPSKGMPESELVPKPVIAVRWETHNEAVLNRLMRLEAKFDQIIKEIPGEWDPHVLTEEEKVLADQKNKIGAIKIHRERTGLGLADSKAIFDEYLKNKSASQD